MTSYQQDAIQNFTFNDWISKLVDEEDEILRIHQTSIEETDKQLREESRWLAKVSQAVSDKEMDDYIQKMEATLVSRIEVYTTLLDKLRLYNKHLNIEGIRKWFLALVDSVIQQWTVLKVLYFSTSSIWEQIKSKKSSFFLAFNERFFEVKYKSLKQNDESFSMQYLHLASPRRESQTL